MKKVFAAALCVLMLTGCTKTNRLVASTRREDGRRPIVVVVDDEGSDKSERYNATMYINQTFYESPEGSVRNFYTEDFDLSVKDSSDEDNIRIIHFKYPKTTDHFEAEFEWYDDEDWLDVTLNPTDEEIQEKINQVKEFELDDKWLRVVTEADEEYFLAALRVRIVADRLEEFYSEHPNQKMEDLDEKDQKKYKEIIGDLFSYYYKWIDEALRAKVAYDDDDSKTGFSFFDTATIDERDVFDYTLNLFNETEEKFHEFSPE